MANTGNELVIKLTGKIQQSNFDDWKKGVLDQIKSIKSDLDTDEDFVEASATVKSLETARETLKDTRESALKQAEDIYKMFTSLDEIDKTLNEKRLELNKKIETQKQKIKSDLVSQYETKASEIIAQQNDDFKNLGLNGIWSSSEFTDAMKNKRTIESMTNALDLVIADIEKRVYEKAKEIDANRVLIDSVEPGYKPLFQDEKALLVMTGVELEATIKSRIAVFDADEIKRKADKEAAKAAEAELQNQPVVEPVAEPQPTSKATFGWGSAQPVATAAPVQEMINNSTVHTISIQIIGPHEQALVIKQSVETVCESVGQGCVRLVTLSSSGVAA